MSAAIRIRCPHCAANLKLKSGADPAKTIRCPKCREPFSPRDAESEPDDDFVRNLDAVSNDQGTPIDLYRAPRIDLRPATVKYEEPVARAPKTEHRRDRRPRGGLAIWTWPLVGLLCGAVAAGLWIVLAEWNTAPLGYYALLVALGVGFGVRIAARGAEGFRPGLISLATTAVVVVIAKLFVAYFLIRNTLACFPDRKVTEREMVLSIAHQVAEECRARGTRIVWPKGQPPAAGAPADEYPETIREFAQVRWDLLDSEDHEAAIAEVKSRLDAAKGYKLGLLFREGFGWVDLFWLGLAALAAFLLGAGAFR